MTLLIQWAVTSSVLILIVLAVRFLLRDRLSARLKYALWGVVLLRLLVPFQVELPAAVGQALPVLASNLAPEVADVELYALRTNSRPLSEDSLAEMRESGIDAGAVLGTQAPIYTFGNLEVEGHTTCRVLSDTGIDTYFFYTTLPRLLMTLWAVGALCAMAVIFCSNRRFLGRLKYYRHALEGVDAPIPVYTAAHLPSPCLFGVLRPAVYLTPGAAEDAATLRHVLAHELTHYAHRDHLWSLLRCLALALHWYNPLVWLAVGLSKGDGELACDEGAVARLGEVERIPYGRTLVDMVAARSLRPGDLLSCSTAMTGGKKSIQQRVAQIVKKPETLKTALFAVIAVVALSAVFVFAEREEPVRNLYGSYRYQVSHTQAVQFSPSLLSSQAYPDAITDPDLLEKALDILDSAADLLNTPEELGLDLSEAPFLSPRVTLLEDTDGSADGHTYLLYTHRLGGSLERCYLVTPAEIGAESYTVAAVLDPSTPGALELLARTQRHRIEEDLTQVTGNVGLSFSDLTPGKEQVKEQTFIVQEVLSDISYSLTYESPVLTLDFGLRTADGTEVVCRTAYGGVANGTFEGISAGSYQIFVRNMGDLNYYTQLPTYQPESGRDNATGAVNFQIIE